MVLKDYLNHKEVVPLGSLLQVRAASYRTVIYGT
jgi:hypothetical protein